MLVFLVSLALTMNFRNWLFWNLDLANPNIKYTGCASGVFIIDFEQLFVHERCSMDLICAAPLKRIRRMFSYLEIHDNSIKIKKDLTELMYNLRIKAEVIVIELVSQ